MEKEFVEISEEHAELFAAVFERPAALEQAMETLALSLRVAKDHAWKTVRERYPELGSYSCRIELEEKRIYLLYRE
jgi:hypothetical protein